MIWHLKWNIRLAAIKKWAFESTSLAILDFSSNWNNCRPFRDGGLNLQIINNSEHACDSSATLDTEPFRVASGDSSADGNLPSVRNQPNTLDARNSTLVQKLVILRTSFVSAYVELKVQTIFRDAVAVIVVSFPERLLSPPMCWSSQCRTYRPWSAGHCRCSRLKNSAKRKCDRVFDSGLSASPS